MRVLIAGVGNVLRGDDGFGVEVARRMSQLELPEGVTVVETGIAGIALVHELQTGWDSVVIVDAVDRGRAPGALMLIKPEVVDVKALTPAESHDMLADMHLANPERVLMLAQALDVLPSTVLLLGCQLTDPDAVGEGLTPAVASAVDDAVTELLRLIDELVAPALPPTAGTR